MGILLLLDEPEDMEAEVLELGDGTLADDVFEMGEKVTGGFTADGRLWPVLLVAICGWLTGGPNEYGITNEELGGSVFPKNDFTWVLVR
jgi:hypothetical protein